MTLIQTAMATLPFLASLASRSGKVIAPCLLASILTVIWGDQPPWAAIAWCGGALIAAIAVRELLGRLGRTPT
jgi:hypothetical protein